MRIFAQDKIYDSFVEKLSHASRFNSGQSGIPLAENRYTADCEYRPVEELYPCQLSIFTLRPVTDEPFRLFELVSGARQLPNRAKGSTVWREFEVSG